MKKVISSILIICLVFITGCTYTSSPPKNDIEIITEDNEKIGIYYPQYDISQITNEEILSWVEYINSKYSLDIDLKYINKVHIESELHDGGESGIDLDELIKKTNLSGFIYINNLNDLAQLIAKGMVIPLNEFYNNSFLASIINEDCVNLYSDINNQIWALPLTDLLSYDVRVYDLNILNNFNLDVPTSITELEFLLQKITENNSNIDKENIYFSEYTNERLLSYFSDIFASFGCYTSNNNPITYNPKNGKYENIILNDNFPDAIKYIKKLKDDSLIINLMAHKTDNEKGEDSEDGVNKLGKLMSAYGIQNYLLFENGKLSYYIGGINTTQLIRGNGSVSCLCVMSETENIQEKINNLFSVFTNGGEEVFWDFKYGQRDYKYFLEDEYINVISMDKAGNRINEVNITVKYTEGNNSNRPVIFDGDTNFLEIAASFKNKHEKFTPEESKVYTVPFGMEMNQINYLNILIYEETARLFQEILDKNIPVEDAIDNYRLKIDEMGVVDSLFLLNNKD